MQIIKAHKFRFRDIYICPMSKYITYNMSLNTNYQNTQIKFHDICILSYVKYNTNPINKDFSTYTIALCHFVLRF